MSLYKVYKPDQIVRFKIKCKKRRSYFHIDIPLFIILIVFLFSFLIKIGNEQIFSHSMKPTTFIMLTVSCVITSILIY